MEIRTSPSIPARYSAANVYQRKVLIHYIGGTAEILSTFQDVYHQKCEDQTIDSAKSSTEIQTLFAITPASSSETASSSQTTYCNG